MHSKIKTLNYLTSKSLPVIGGLVPHCESFMSVCLKAEVPHFPNTK